VFGGDVMMVEEATQTRLQCSFSALVISLYSVLTAFKIIEITFIKQFF